jgi:cysteinyl-tRNA synthetase
VNIQLFNTASRKVEQLKPLTSGKISFYSCGPTVYDYPHIGNWYAFIRWDLVYRILTHQGNQVNWVMNITDVGHLTSDADEGQDKLEKGAKQEGITAWQIANKYTEYFTKGLSRLNISQPTKLPKATEHIGEQIEMINQLQKKGYTYIIDDGVYFDTSKFASYSDFARLDLLSQKSTDRVGSNVQKRNASDFALWKFSPKDKKRDMEWNSPWGTGFPGWHIECSAMSISYLGSTLDIHSGGIDHIPVHHTNEIAQSEAVTGQKFANHWLHSNFLLIDNQKISKSLKNYFTLEDIEKKGYSLMAFRLLVIQSHYRTEAHFSWDNLESASNLLSKLYAWSDLQFQNLSSNEYRLLANDINLKIIDSLNNDLNTPEALAWVNKLINQLDTLGADSNAIKHTAVQLDDLFGLGLTNRTDIDSETKELLKKRSQARKDKNWVLSDQLRDQLLAKNIIINDTSQGQTWHLNKI